MKKIIEADTDGMRFSISVEPGEVSYMIDDVPVGRDAYLAAVATVQAKALVGLADAFDLDGEDNAICMLSMISDSLELMAPVSGEIAEDEADEDGANEGDS